MEQGEKTFIYSSKADLKKQKGMFLKELNEDHDENGNYEEVYYFDESIGEMFNLTPQYNTIGTPSFIDSLFMGKLNVIYKYSTLDHEHIKEYPNRCVWNYLKYRLNISPKILRKYNTEDNDRWSLESLLEMAQGENYRLQIYDTQMDIIKINDIEAVHIPEGEDCRKHRQSICFMVADNHIYPYTTEFQSKLLRSDNYLEPPNSTFTLKENVKTLDTINKIEDEEEKMVQMDNRRDEEADLNNHIAIDEQNFIFQMTEMYKYIYVKNRIATDSEGNTKVLPATNLNQLAEKIFTLTNEIYPVTLYDGNIKSIYYKEYDKELKKNIKKWEIFADPNYDITKPICDTLGILYNHTDISSIGLIMYNNNGGNMKELKSDMLDDVLTTPYKAFTNNQLIGVPDTDIEHNFDFESTTLDYASIDINKSYSYGLENPYSEWCVYTPLDTIVPYKKIKLKKKKPLTTNHVVKKEKSYSSGWYYVVTQYSKDLHGLFIPFERRFPNGWYCPAVLELADEKHIPYTITKQYIPIKTLKKTHFKQFVTDLYSKLGNDAKMPINSFIGRLGKRDNVKIKSKGSVITSEYDIKYFKNKEQIVKPITKSLFVSYKDTIKQAHTIASPLYNQIIQEAWCRLQKLHDSINYTKMETIHNFQVFTPLEWKFGYKNGAKHFLGEMSYEDYMKKITIKKRVTQGGAVYFNTDSVVIVGEDLSDMIKNVNFGTERGDNRIEWDKTNSNYSQRIDTIQRRKINEYMLSEELSDIHIKAVESYDSSSIYDLVEAEQGFQLLGMAGTGKSYTTAQIVEYLNSKSLKFKVIAFTHSAIHNDIYVKNGVSTQTIHSFLKLNFTNAYSKASYSQCTDLDYILVDEISLVPPNMIVHFRNIKEKYKTKFIFVGDYQQLDPIDKYYTNDTIGNSAIIKYLTDYNKITLTTNKRSGEEGEYMFDLFNNILYGDNKMIEKHKLTEHWRNIKPYPMYHICYTNKKRQEINNQVIQDIIQFKKPKQFIISNPNAVLFPLICFEHILIRCKNNSNDYYNNQTFQVMNVREEVDKTQVITLFDLCTKKEIDIGVAEYHKDFEYGYAGTCHKYQGATISARFNYVIHEWDLYEWHNSNNNNNSNKSRRWLYVACSRASNSNQFKIV